MRKITQSVAIVAAIVITYSSTAYANGILYVAESVDAFLTQIDPNTADEGGAFFVVDPGYTSVGLRAMAVDPLTGEIYAVMDTAEDAFDRLIKGDPRTGVVTDIGNTGQKLTGLAFDSAGTLYGVTSDDVSGTEDTIFTINTSTAALTLFMPLPGPDGFGDTIAYNPDDGKLYHWSGSNTVSFHAIDLTTKGYQTITLSGDRPAGVGVTAFTYDTNQHLFIAYREDLTQTTMQYATITSTGVQTYLTDAVYSGAGLGFFDGDPSVDVPNPKGGRNLYSVDLQGPYIAHVDPATGADLAVRGMTTPSATITGSNGLAINPVTGDVYVVVRYASGGTRRLGTVNPQTGDVTIIGDMGAQVSAISFDSEGTLYAVTGTRAPNPETLFTVDLTTAAMTVVKAIGSGKSGHAIAFNPDDGQMYHAEGWDPVLVFEKIDLDTLVETAIPYSGDMFTPTEVLSFTYDTAQGLFLGCKWNAADADYYTVTPDGFVTVIGSQAIPKKGYAFSVPAYTNVAGLPDINGNGHADLAVIVQAASSHVQVRDGSTGDLITDIDYGDDPISGMAVIDDISGNGMPEIALAGTRPDGQIRVQVMDSKTGAPVNNIFYGNAYSAVDMTVLPDTNGNGADELVVLGADASGGVRAQARDAQSDATTRTVYFGNNTPPENVVSLVDVSGNGEPEIIMHGRVTASSQGRAQMRDSLLAGMPGFIRNMFFGTAYRPLQLVAIQDVSGDGIADLAQLAVRDDTGAVRIQVKRTDTGVTVSNAYTGTGSKPVALVGIGNANPITNTVPDVALLVEEPDGTAKVILRDGATGEFIKNIFASAVSNPVAIALVPDLNGSGNPELAVLGDDGNGTKRVQIKDSISGAYIGVIDFP